MPKKRDIQTGAGWPDVANNIVSFFSDLILAGNIIGVIVFAAIIYLITVAWRIPPEELGPFTVKIYHCISYNKFPYMILVVSFGINLALFRKIRVYKKEIHSQRKIMRKLYHGREVLGWDYIEKHTSSDFSFPDIDCRDEEEE